MFYTKITLDNGMVRLEINSASKKCELKVGDEYLVEVFFTTERGNPAVEYYKPKIKSIEMYEVEWCKEHIGVDWCKEHIKKS